MNKKYSISVVVPLYNEAQLVELSIRKIDDFLKEHIDDYEIIIVESGSTDGSSEISSKLEDELDSVIVIHEGSRNGFGSAVRLGYKKANKDLVLFQTVDFCFQMDILLNALPLFDKYDCVLSYRTIDNRPVFNKIRSFIFNSIVKMLLGLKVRHVNSAFKCFKKDTIKQLNLMSNGWLIDTEINYRIQKKNLCYVEIPIGLFDRKVAKSSVNWKTPFFIIKDLLYFLRIKDK